VGRSLSAQRWGWTSPLSHRSRPSSSYRLVGQSCSKVCRCLAQWSLVLAGSLTGGAAASHPCEPHHLGGSWAPSTRSFFTTHQHPRGGASALRLSRVASPRTPPEQDARGDPHYAGVLCFWRYCFLLPPYYIQGICRCRSSKPLESVLEHLQESTKWFFSKTMY
jgi:hypothetical protein